MRIVGMDIRSFAQVVILEDSRITDERPVDLVDIASDEVVI